MRPMLSEYAVRRLPNGEWEVLARDDDPHNASFRVWAYQSPGSAPDLARGRSIGRVSRPLNRKANRH